MNTFFLTPKINLEGGGSNTNTDLRIRALLDKGHKVKVITLFSQYNRLSGQNRYEIITYNRQPRAWIFINFFVYKILKNYERGAHLFYIDGPQFFWGAGLYKLLGKRPVIVHLNVLPYVILEHGTRLFSQNGAKTSRLKQIKFWIRTKIGGYIDIYLAKKIDSFTCTSPIIRQQCIDFGFAKKNLDLLPEFIDTKIFSGSDRKRAVTGHRKRLLYVGRLVPCKGVDLLISAVGNLGRQDVSLDIVGDGPEFRKLETLAETLNLKDRIRFYKWVKRGKLKTIYEQADVFVHPARWAEPLGITVVEAMMTGLPVIVPRISGSAWVAGKAGLTFQNGDEKDLREKITMLLDDDALYNELQKNALPEAQKLDYKQWVEKFESIIRAISLPRNSSPAA